MISPRKNNKGVSLSFSVTAGHVGDWQQKPAVHILAETFHSYQNKQLFYVEILIACYY
jgi:hypothetical protein